MQRLPYDPLSASRGPQNENGKDGHEVQSHVHKNLNAFGFVLHRATNVQLAKTRDEA